MHIGFFGNTPEEPKVIFETDLLPSFRNSWLRGMSASNLCIEEHQGSGGERFRKRPGALGSRAGWRHTTGGIPIQIRISDSVGTVEFSPGRFGDCGACAKVPEFADPSMTAMRQQAGKVLSRAQLKLEGVLATGQGILMDLTADVQTQQCGHGL